MLQDRACGMRGSPLKIHRKENSIVSPICKVFWAERRVIEKGSWWATLLCERIKPRMNRGPFQNVEGQVLGATAATMRQLGPAMQRLQ